MSFSLWVEFCDIFTNVFKTVNSRFSYYHFVTITPLSQKMSANIGTTPSPGYKMFALTIHVVIAIFLCFVLFSFAILIFMFVLDNLLLAFYQLPCFGLFSLFPPPSKEGAIGNTRYDWGPSSRQVSQP